MPKKTTTTYSQATRRPPCDPSPPQQSEGGSRTISATPNPPSLPSKLFRPSPQPTLLISSFICSHSESMFRAYDLRSLLLLRLFGFGFDYSIDCTAMGYSIRNPKIPAALFSLRSKKNTGRDSFRQSLLVDEPMNTAVPKGCMAVYVGDGMRRFVIPTSYLRLPAFRQLMEKVEEEFGFDQAGGLRIPCEEEDFQELLDALADSMPAKPKKKTLKSLVKMA
ncbi:hypothetical protein B296_00045663 [Ensete ventricosum]|uniref:Auxin-responsive protein n=1 Tax=Ensete ventricosum TaxID=4639 RepID=A0A426X911_ENSVE|nr:hypothetical protein B296_00045663 [Ensete ventricosum]